MGNNLEDLRRALYASIRSFIDALEASDVVADARFNETPEEAAERYRAEAAAIWERLEKQD